MEPSVVEELWRVYTYYTIRGHAASPDRLATSQLLRLCRDARLSEAGLRRRALIAGDVELACASLRRLARAKGSSKKIDETSGLTFADFLRVLLLLAKQLEESRKQGGEATSGEEAFERLLAESILPFARRREVPCEVGDESDAVLNYLDDELFELFAYHSAGAVREDDSELRWAKYTLSSTESHRSSTGASKRVLDEATYMGWPEFRRFARETTLDEACTAVQLAEAYVSSVRRRGKGFTLDFDVGLKEVLVRCATALFPDIPTARKLKALLVRLLQRGLASAHDHALLRSDLGPRLRRFHERYRVLWEHDGYVDYSVLGGERKQRLLLHDDDEESSDPRDVLSRLLCAARVGGGDEEEDARDFRPVRLRRDVDDLGDTRFTVDDLDALIKANPTIGRLLSLHISSSAINERRVAPESPASDYSASLASSSPASSDSY